MNISVVVPVYNEENNLLEVLNEIHVNLQKNFNNFEIIIVDDNSSDRSLEIAKKFAQSQAADVSIIQHKKNHGSGKAIYSGIIRAKFDLVMYVPADGQFDCSEIIQYAEAGRNADVVLGVRSDRHDYSLFRKISSFVFISSFNFIFNGKYKDINWIHLWKKDIFKQIQISSDGVFFLGELVAKAKNSGYHIIEIPSVYRVRKSGIAKGGKLKTILKTIIEMIKIKMEL